AAALGAGGMLLPASPTTAACSVFSRYPCPMTSCSVFHRGPCIPEIEYPIGQDLRLTIESDEAPNPPPSENVAGPAAQSDGSDNGGSTSTERRLNTIMEMYGALRGCWVPPALGEARPGMQMSVRLSFKRTGEIIGTPRVTYTSPDAPREARDTYHDAITRALE